MTRRLPPHDPPVSDDELDAARDDDALIELRETDRALAQGPHGLAFVLSLDMTPTMRMLDALAAVLTKPKRKRKPRLKSKPKA